MMCAKLTLPVYTARHRPAMSLLRIVNTACLLVVVNRHSGAVGTSILRTTADVPSATPSAVDSTEAVAAVLWHTYSVKF